MTVFTIVDFKKRLLDGSTSSRFQETHLHGTTIWQIPMTQLPMGTVVAQDIFQSKLDAIFIGMEGVTGIADDMVIAGKDEMEHDRNFLAFMEKCMENNLPLNSEKIQFKQTQVSFYGHCWSKYRDFTRSTEDTGIEAHGVPTRQGNHEIFPRNDQLS